MRTIAVQKTALHPDVAVSTTASREQCALRRMALDEWFFRKKPTARGTRDRRTRIDIKTTHQGGTIDNELCRSTVSTMIQHLLKCFCVIAAATRH
jgi:hypothetical protein